MLHGGIDRGHGTGLYLLYTRAGCQSWDNTIRTGIKSVSARIIKGLMLKRDSYFRPFPLVLLFSLLPNCSKAPPVAEKRPHVLTVHGQSLADDYFWLREKSDPKVLDYLRLEDIYAQTAMKSAARLEETLYQEELSRVQQTDQTFPYEENGYFYYSKTREGLQYPVYCRKRGSLGAAEEVILDQNELAKGQAFYSIGARVVSDDGNLLAYTEDTVGYRQYVLKIKDLRSGQLLPGRIERVDAVVWAADNKTLFYVTEDPTTKRANKFWRHVIGKDKDDLVYEEKDDIYELSCERTRDKALVLMLVLSEDHPKEVQFLSADDPSGAVKVVLPRSAEIEYDVDHRGNVFFIRTNKNAQNFRIVSAPVADPSERNWKDVIPHRPAVKIDSINVFSTHALVAEKENGLDQMEILDLKAGSLNRVMFPEPIYSASVGDNREFQTGLVRYNYESLVTPPSVFDYDLSSGRSVLRKQKEIPGGFDRAKYVSERIFATAADGVVIPISLVYKKGMQRDGRTPLLLTGYGAYGYAAPLWFNTANLFRPGADPILPLLDRGVIYAVAHVRGGGEMGEPWRDGGRLMQKMNTFTDFIACAEYLIRQKFTAKDRLIIRGASAGGLLVTAAANMRPDLFKAVIAEVPFADVMNDMLDASMPLTTSEYVEWGNPNREPDFQYMLRYSPYENVRAQAYPAILVRVSVNDSQVGYWEGAKLVAKLRRLKTDSNALLMKVNFGAGHGGASGRYDAFRDTAFAWTFLLQQVGILK
jgi:oligopeptidase B